EKTGEQAADTLRCAWLGVLEVQNENASLYGYNRNLDAGCCRRGPGVGKTTAQGGADQGRLHGPESTLSRLRDRPGSAAEKDRRNQGRSGQLPEQSCHGRFR